MQNETAELKPLSMFERLKNMKPCVCEDCICASCGGKMVRYSSTKIIRPNEYFLFDVFTCKECKLTHRKDICEIDKNTPGTRAILAGKNRSKENAKVKQKWGKIKKQFGELPDDDERDSIAETD